MTIEDRVRVIYLHNFMWYYGNKIDVDELCRRIRKMDIIVNQHSKYYKFNRHLDALKPLKVKRYGRT